MSALWPAELPQKFDESGFSEEFGNNVITTEMDSGPPKKRRRFTASVDKISGKMYMTQSQANTLETFYKTTCADGSIDVEMLHPRTGSSVILQWDAPPAITPAVSGVYVSLSFKVMP